APINIPIWQTESSARITQNYITEDNYKTEPGLDDLKEIGRLQFRGRFKTGMDESHEAFISDNNTRETFETWEACLAEGVRTRKVDKELPDQLQQLHEQSLTEGRDVLKQASDEEKQKWLEKDGADWSGAFGHDPKAYMDTQGRKRREPGAEEPYHDDPHHPSDNDHSDETYESDSSDLGIQDAKNAGKAGNMSGQKERQGKASTDGTRESFDTSRTNDTADTMNSSMSASEQRKRTEQRRHRGMMQWKPARNLKFAKDEGKIGLNKLKKKLTGSMEGRKPDVETETG
ncbi:hypothetical protein LTS18_012476, partial [Coniosporium uncinatum]